MLCWPALWWAWPRTRGLTNYVAAEGTASGS